MRSDSLAETPELTGADRPRLIIARDVAPVALGMYGAWLAAMLGVWIWAEHRRRRDVERALEALRAHRMSYVPPHMHTAADFRPHGLEMDEHGRPRPGGAAGSFSLHDGDGAAVITLPLPQSEGDGLDD